MTKTIESNKFSFAGWSFKTWAVKNKEALKILLSAFAGLATGFVADLSPLWATFAGTVVAAIVKLLTDTLDYWQSE